MWRSGVHWLAKKRKKVLTTVSFIKCPAQGEIPYYFNDKGLSAGEAVEVKKRRQHRRDWAGTRQTKRGTLTREDGGKVKGREGDAPLGDAFTARSHRIATLDSHHRPDTHTTNTPDRLTLSSTQRRERRVRHNLDRRRKKGAPSKTQAQRERSGDLKNGREKKKGSTPTGQAETNSLKRPKTLQGVEPHRALTASNVVWQEPSPTLRCKAQRCGSDAIPPRGCQLAAMLVPPPRLPSPQGHPQWPCRRGALRPYTLRVCGVQSEEDLPRQC